jgi:hypothetical protein
VLQVLLANFALLDFLTRSYKAQPVRVVLGDNIKELQVKPHARIVVLALQPQIQQLYLVLRAVKDVSKTKVLLLCTAARFVSKVST